MSGIAIANNQKTKIITNATTSLEDRFFSFLPSVSAPDGSGLFGFSFGFGFGFGFGVLMIPTVLY
ncbi:MAG: hypothetical protein U0105_13880 [Candidatus Obscuribacterales bacterium]